MQTIEVIGHVDEDHRLSAEVPASVGPGVVRIRIEVELNEPACVDSAELREPQEWDRAVARDWAEDWNDPREDIYTEQDGEPVDEPR